MVIARAIGGGAGVSPKRRRVGMLLAQVLAAASLAGCTHSPIEMPATTETHHRPPPATGASSAPMVQPETSKKKGENWTAVAHPKPSPPPIDPHSVVGATEGEAEKLLGTPAAIADRAPALVWEYHGKQCALSLHFYMDVNTQIYRVLTYDVTPKTVTESSCFASVRKGGG